MKPTALLNRIAADRRRSSTGCIATNTFLDSGALERCQSHIQRMRGHSPELRRHLDQARIRGLKSWEYCGLLCNVGDLYGVRVIDVGSGRSLFGSYLRSMGARVTTFDLPTPHQPEAPSAIAQARRSGVFHASGNMLTLPFATGSFDLALSISVVEHLQQNPKDLKGEPRPYGDFIADTRIAVRELARCVAPGGYLYLSTDLFDSERQVGDDWWRHGSQVACAYRVADFDGLFVGTLTGAGLTFDRPTDFDFRAVLRDPTRSNYRGRYFTTFSLLMRRPAF